MESKILFLDLDGTLLNDRKELTDGNRQAISDAIGRGHRVVIASGRPLKSVRAQAARFGLDAPGCYAIAYNGAVVYDFTQQRQIFRRSMEPDDLYTVFDEARRRGIYIQTYDREDVVIEPGSSTEYAERYCARIQLEYRVIADVRKDLSEMPVKALSIDFDGQEKTDAFRRWILSEMPGRLDSYFSDKHFLEIVPAGVNKGQGILKLCELLGVPPERSVAAGDEANDMDMIRTAGVGAAMSNAIPELKAAADYVTRRDNNHDGVAEIIARFLP
ncbi:MAG: HAD family phosphatase [Oscillibacter sp.]|nr:HAD family phosphatase [Oscillibacter sp.]